MVRLTLVVIGIYLDECYRPGAEGSNSILTTDCGALSAAPLAAASTALRRHQVNLWWQPRRRAHASTAVAVDSPFAI